jgi:hypothetical protein
MVNAVEGWRILSETIGIFRLLLEERGMVTIESSRISIV